LNSGWKAGSGGGQFFAVGANPLRADDLAVMVIAGGILERIPLALVAAVQGHGLLIGNEGLARREARAWDGGDSHLMDDSPKATNPEQLGTRHKFHGGRVRANKLPVDVKRQLRSNAHAGQVHALAPDKFRFDVAKLVLWMGVPKKIPIHADDP
jgi:hypothetical protein